MSNTNEYGFKGASPENPKIMQLISYLYIGVAYLNDGVLSKNEVIRMVNKHIEYGLSKEKSLSLLEEARSWWNDSKEKGVHFDDLVQCAELIKNNKGWNDDLKETIHMDLTLITTADGLLDLKSGKNIAEHKLKVVTEIMKLLEV